MLYLVCSYGVYDSDFNPESLHDYDRYVQGVKSVIAKTLSRDRVVFCGGYTHPESGISESESLRELIAPDFPDHKFFVETTSFYTQENIMRGIESKRNTNIGNVTVICDMVREYKVRVLCEILLEPLGINWDVIALERNNTNFEQQVEQQRRNTHKLTTRSEKFQAEVASFHETMTEYLANRTKG